MAEKYVQRKYWPTRRIHLYEVNDDGYAICGGAMTTATYEKFGTFTWTIKGAERHPYDDLNFCQSCRRVAESRHGRKMLPLSKYYAQHVFKK